MASPMLILGIVGNVISVLMFLSPVPTFWKIFKSKSTQSFSGLPYVVTLFNCLLWVLYGLPLVITNGMLVMTINGAGVGFETIYITLFLTYADKFNRVKVTKLLGLILGAYAAIVTVTLAAIHHQPTRKLEVGSLCVIVTVAMYVAPLSVMKLVIKTKSVAFMPFFLSFFIFLNSAVWTGYGVFSKDIFIMIPNGLGTLFGFAQLALHAIYGRNKTPVDIEHGDPPTKAHAAKGLDHTQSADVTHGGL